MVTRLRRLAWVAAPLLLLLAVVPSAYAAEQQGRIDQVGPGPRDNTIAALYSLPGLPPTSTPDLDTIAVIADDKPVQAEAELVKDAEQRVQRITVLAIDVSSSMSGERFEAAKEAARTYIELAPPDVEIGLVTFASEVETVATPTTDHASVLAAIDELTLSSQTRLYDAVLQSLDVAGTEGVRSILLLSDGIDRGSEADLETATNAAAVSGVRIDAVALEQDAAAATSLEEIATASGGGVTPSNADDLEALYAAQAAELETQIVVTFPVPEGIEGDTTLTVSVQAAGDTYVDTTVVNFADLGVAGPSYESTSPGFGALSAQWLIAGLSLLFVGVAVMLAMGFTRAASLEPTPLQKQMQFYTVQGAETRGPRPSARDATSLRGAAVAAAGLLVKDRDLEQRLGMKIDRAGLKLTASEWVLVHIGFAVVLPLAGLLLTGGNAFVIMLCLLIGIVLPWLFLSFKESRRIKAFNSQLAQTLQIVAGALQAGLSLSQAVDTVVHDGSAPVAEEFRRAIIEQRLGVTIDDALDAVADRMDSRDFKWVVMAIRIQRQVGGNLAELILTVAATLREREYLRRQVSVLSAEGRLSAWILGGLPILFFGYLSLARPEYLQPMLDSPLGLAMLGLAALLLCTGGLWLRQSVKVEV